ELQLKLQVSLFTLGAGLGVARSLIRRRSEMPVPAPALSAPRDRDAFLRRVEVCDEQVALLGIEYHRARRHVDDQVVSAFAVHLLPHAGLALLRTPVVFAGKVEQRVLVGVGEEDDRAAVAPVAAVGAAFGDVLLAPEGHAPVPAVAGLDVNGS